jgi:hypothetical protein
VRSRLGLQTLAGALALTLATPAEAATKKFALAMMHFNIQYVAGGVVGLGGSNSERTAEQIEDLIVTESFEPVLDLFLAHPTWGQDIEMQGYMLEVIAQRHPRVLDKLKELVVKGQIDVDSFHYSDQFFIAYPPIDWERSQTLNDETFAKAGLRHAGSVFCQEGQTGAGFIEPMKAHGYSLLVFPPNLWKKLHAEGPAPLYKFGDGRMLVAQDPKTDTGTSTTAGADTIEAKWTFLDDGELLATNGSNPYIVSGFRHNPGAVAEYEQKLAALEADGYAIAPVSHYAKALEESGVVPAETPAILDGTWQPQSTDSSYKWLGGRGIWIRDERDNDVRTLDAVGHRELVVAEALATKAGIDAHDELRAAWRLLVLGEVSDGSGINPIRGEIEYCLAHVSEALRIARDVIARAKTALGATSVLVDAATGDVTLGGSTAAAGRSIALGPIAPVVDAPEHDSHMEWAELEPGHFLLTVTIRPAEARAAQIRFPGTLDDIVYTPALTASPVRLPRAAFSFDRVTLALPDGLIGLGGDLFLVKDQAFAHLGAQITADSGDVVFSDETVPANEEAIWKFHVVRGTLETAAAIAKAINVAPKVLR